MSTLDRTHTHARIDLDYEGLSDPWFFRPSAGSLATQVRNTIAIFFNNCDRIRIKEVKLINDIDAR